MEHKEKDIEKLFEGAKKISLEKDKKQAIKLAIVSGTSIPQKANKPVLSYFSIFSFTRMSLVPMLLVLVFVGGGVSLAAEKAIPGNILYPVKTGFNEQITRIFSISPEAKAQWESKVAIRRLREAVELEANGNTAKSEEILENNFSLHAERFSQKVEELNKDGVNKNAEKLKDNFEKSLEEHTKTLARLDEKGQNISNKLSRLGFVVPDQSDTKKDDNDPTDRGEVIAINNIPVERSREMSGSRATDNENVTNPQVENDPEENAFNQETSIMSLTLPENDNEEVSLKGGGITNISYTSEGLRNVYSKDEVIEIELTAINKTDQIVELNLTNNCEFYYSIGEFDSSDHSLCNFSIVKVLLEPGKSHIWNIEIDLNKISIKPGEYELMYGISGGYFEDSRKITIE